MSQLPGVAPPEKPPRTRATPRVLDPAVLDPAALDDVRGSVAVEYALLGAVMTLIAIGSFTLFGDAADGLWRWLSGELSGAMSP